MFSPNPALPFARHPAARQPSVPPIAPATRDWTGTAATVCDSGYAPGHTRQRRHVREGDAPEVVVATTAVPVAILRVFFLFFFFCPRKRSFPGLLAGVGGGLLGLMAAVGGPRELHVTRCAVVEAGLAVQRRLLRTATEVPASDVRTKAGWPSMRECC